MKSSVFLIECDIGKENVAKWHRRITLDCVESKIQGKTMQDLGCTEACIVIDLEMRYLLHFYCRKNRIVVRESHSMRWLRIRSWDWLRHKHSPSHAQ